MDDKCDILIVGQTPPPFHGQAVVTDMLFKHEWKAVKVCSLRMAYSDSIDAVGRPGLGKVCHLISLVFKTWMIRMFRRPTVLYYLPASANTAPIWRDILYLGLVRWAFSKTVFHYHAAGLPEFVGGMKRFGWLARRAYGGADLSIDVIETKPATGSHFASKSNVVVRNGVDVELLESNDNKKNEFSVLFVGLLIEGKGVTQIVETANLVKEQGHDFEFTLVGEWESKEFKREIEVLLKEYSLEDNVLFTGPLSGREKWTAFANADCFFFPSHYQSETFGLVLVEAMAYGLPLVTTRWRGIPRVVEGGDCAILCDTKSPDQYAQALVDIANDSNIYDEMSRSSSEHYKRNFTKKCFLSDMENAFERVLINPNSQSVEEY